MKPKFTMILTLLALEVQFVFAQQKTVSGTVSDENNMPLPGATVLVAGTSSGTTTDFDGKFQLNVNTGDVLEISYVGYAIQSLTIGIANSYNVTLETDNSLEEVVITSILGIDKKKDDDLSSATKVNTEALKRSKESGVIQGLAGKTSGLKITRNTGDPGAGAYIQIRGQNSLNGNSAPLIIIDGIPVLNTSVGSGTAGVAQQSRLNDIPSDDIESVTVLKGVSATSVWGSGAANGAIVIKTKKGRSINGQARKTSVAINSTVAYDEINVEFDKQSKFGQGFNGTWVPNTGLSWGDKISDRPGGNDLVTLGNQRFESNTGNIIYPITEKNSRAVYNGLNKNQVFGSGLTTNNSVSLTTSSENGSSFLSYSNFNQDGIIKENSNYNRQTFRLNQTTQFSDKLSAVIIANYSKVNSDRIQQGSNLNGLYLGYLRTSPDFNNRDYKGTYYDQNNVPTLNAHRGYRRYLGDRAPVYNNPGWTINEQKNPNNVERFIINPQVRWQINDNTSITARYGLDYYTDHREALFPVNSAAGLSVGQYVQSDIQEKNQNFNVFLNNFNEVSDNFNFSTTLGFSLDRNEYSVIGGFSTQFTNPFIGDLTIFGNANAENETPSNFNSEERKSGAYAVLNAELFNQLLVEISGRLDRTSTLVGNIFYPAASIGWKFSQLFDDESFLSFGKIRLGYGEIGITPGPYATTTTFGPGGVFSSWGDGLSAAAYQNPFTRSSILGNPDLKEERVSEFEVGIDLRLFKNRLNLSATYYDRMTEDAILAIDVAPSSGYTSTNANVAELTNKGLEVDLLYKLVDNENLAWSVSANYSHNKNLVTDLNGVESVFLNGFTGTSSRIVEGHAVGTLWGGKFARDDSGAYVLDSNNFPTIAEEEGVLGDPNPDWIGGLGTVINFKGFTLSAQFETSQGNDHWTGTEGVLKYFGIHPETANESVALSDLKTFGGTTIPAGTTFRGNVGNFGGSDVALTQDWYLASGGGFGNQSETFVQDASWTRLREISLSYAFSKKLTDRLGISGASVTISGRNLALWTKVEGFDPDINLTGDSLGRGLDYFTNPATKTYSLTLNVTL